MAATTLRFADYELDLSRRELRRDGVVVELQPTPRRVLLYLAEHRDRTVSRRELLDALWAGVVVGDEALTRALAEIRRAVGDDGDAQRVIRTLRGEGYRFVADTVESAGSATSELDEPQSRNLLAHAPGDVSSRMSPVSPPHPAERGDTIYSVLGSTELRPTLEPPETLRLVSVLGSIVLDLREVALPLDITEVECRVYLGSVEILVPRGVDVELTGSVVLGSVETTHSAEYGLGRRERELPVDRNPADEVEDRPLLCVDCSGVMGSIELKLS